MHHGTQGVMLLGKPEEKEMIIHMGPWGTLCMQSINGTDTVAKSRFHMSYAPQRVLKDEERQYFGYSIHTAVCIECSVVGFRKQSHLSSFAASITVSHQRSVSLVW